MMIWLELKRNSQEYMQKKKKQYYDKTLKKIKFVIVVHKVVL